MSVLCYHAVDPTWTSPLSVTPEAFDEHCAWLAKARDVVPLDVAVQAMDRRGRLPRGMVALTFDDGFLQLRDHVFPALARHGLPATVFLVAATLTEEGQAVDWVDTPPPWELQTLDLADVRAAQHDGIRFASHSWSHHTLPDLDEDTLLTDLRRSREFLEDVLHEPVGELAYPRGQHSETVRRTAAAAGYAHSWSLPESREVVGPHALPRVGVFPGNGLMTLRGKTQPAYLPVRHSPVFPALRRLARR